MEKKTNKGIIAAAAVVGAIVCILIGVLIGLAVINGGGSDELVTDAFCEMVKDSGEKTYYRIPKLNIKKNWAQEVNERMYTTLYDEYEKGKVLYYGNTATVSEMGYEWAEKDGIVSITVQLKNAFTGRYEFFVFNVDTQKEREITDEELIEAFGYDKTEYFGMMKDVIRDIYNKEISEMTPTDYIYDSLLEEATKDESLENTLSFITEEGKLNVILPVFSADEKENVETIVDIATGELQDYFTFDEEYEEIPAEELISDTEEASENGNDSAERLDITDDDITDIVDMINRRLGLYEFDYRSINCREVIQELLSFSLGVSWYSLYFDDYIDYNDFGGTGENVRPFIPDPLNRFVAQDMHYLVMPEENVKWVTENIFHVEYTPDFENQPISYESEVYLYDGNIYRELTYGGDIGCLLVHLGNTKLEDGRYEIVFRDDVLADDPDFGPDYFVIVADVQIIDGRRCLTFYSFDRMNEDEFRTRESASSLPQDNSAPTEEDMNDLYSMLGYSVADFNSNTSDTAYVINKYITSIFGIGDYGIYFNDGRVVNSYSGNEPKDPRGWFEAYSVLPAENVRWMCENVYNIEFDENYISDNSYCEGGYVYTYAIIAGDGPMTSRVKHTKKLSDGRYAILLESGYTDYPSEILQVYEEISIIAEIKTTDGKRHWSFYDVKTRKIR